MIYDATLIAGLAMTFGIMAVGIKAFGVGGGFAGFFIGAILTGVIAASSGADLDYDRCERYSSIVNDC